MEFQRAAFGGELAALGTEAEAVRATPAVDGNVPGMIVVVSRAEGEAAKPAVCICDDCSKQRKVVVASQPEQRVCDDCGALG